MLIVNMHDVLRVSVTNLLHRIRATKNIFSRVLIGCLYSEVKTADLFIAIVLKAISSALT